MVTFKDGTKRFLKEKIYDPRKTDQPKRWEIGYDKILNKDWFFSHDPKSGRLFNNIANLPRDLRSFLLLDRQKLVEIDIANCQPLLLYSFYDKESEESLRYKKMVESGNFYEKLNNLGKNSLDFEIEETRGIFKKAIYKQILFCRNWYKNKPLWAVFQNEFPILAAKIIEIKRGDYRKLAHKLQKLEADIVIKGVVDKIRKTMPELKILTVHDSVLCPPQHAQLVEKVIKESVFEKIGVVPKITRKEPEIPTGV